MSRAVRHLPPPSGLRAQLHAARFGLARRAVQAMVLLAFYGTLHWGFTVAGRPLLAGNLSAAELAGVLPLADPFAALQLLAARHQLATELLLGAALTTAFYALLGGRVFCAWVCPMNAVTDTAALLRTRLGFGSTTDLLRLPPSTRLWVLALALGVSLLAGVPAFEAFSPVAALPRELLYGAGWGLVAAGGILLLDTFVQHRGWCGHLCPLGAFWSLVGHRRGLLKLAFDDAACTRCGDCVKACPEPRVLHFDDIARDGAVRGGACTRCARCIAVCPESALRFALRPAPRVPQATPSGGTAP